MRNETWRIRIPTEGGEGRGEKEKKKDLARAPRAAQGLELVFGEGVAHVRAIRMLEHGTRLLARDGMNEG